VGQEVRGDDGAGSGSLGKNPRALQWDAEERVRCGRVKLRSVASVESVQVVTAEVGVYAVASWLVADRDQRVIRGNTGRHKTGISAELLQIGRKDAPGV